MRYRLENGHVSADITALSPEEIERLIKLYAQCRYWQKPWYAWWYAIPVKIAAYTLWHIQQSQKNIASSDWDHQDMQAAIARCLAQDAKRAWPLNWYYRYCIFSQRYQRAKTFYLIMRWLRQQRGNLPRAEQERLAHLLWSEIDDLWQLPLTDLLIRIYVTMNSCVTRRNNHPLSKRASEAPGSKKPMKADKEIADFCRESKHAKSITCLREVQADLGSLLTPPKPGTEYRLVLRNSITKLRDEGVDEIADLIEIQFNKEPCTLEPLKESYASVVKHCHRLRSDDLLNHASITASTNKWLCYVKVFFDWYMDAQFHDIERLPNSCCDSVLERLTPLLTKNLLLDLPRQLSSSKKTDQQAIEQRYSLNERVLRRAIQLSEQQEQLRRLDNTQVTIKKLAQRNLEFSTDAKSTPAASFEKYLNNFNQALVELKDIHKELINYPEHRQAVDQMLHHWYQSMISRLYTLTETYRESLITSLKDANQKLQHCTPYLSQLLVDEFCVEVIKSGKSLDPQIKRYPNRYLVSYQEDNQFTRFLPAESSPLVLSIEFVPTPGDDPQQLSGGRYADLFDVVSQAITASASSSLKGLLELLKSPDTTRPSSQSERISPLIKVVHQRGSTEVKQWLQNYDAVVHPQFMQDGNYNLACYDLLHALEFFKSEQLKEQPENVPAITQEMTEIHRVMMQEVRKPQDAESYQQLYDKYKHLLIENKVRYLSKDLNYRQQRLDALQPIIACFKQLIEQHPEIKQAYAEVENRIKELRFFGETTKRQVLAQLHPDKQVYPSTAENMFQKMSQLFSLPDYRQMLAGQLSVTLLLEDIQQEVSMLQTKIGLDQYYIELAKEYGEERTIQSLVDYYDGNQIPDVFAARILQSQMQLAAVSKMRDASLQQLDQVKKQNQKIAAMVSLAVLKRFPNLAAAKKEKDTEDLESYKEALTFLLQAVAEQNQAALSKLLKLATFSEQCAEAWSLKEQGEIVFDGPAPPVEYFGKYAPHYNQQLVVWKSRASLFAATTNPQECALECKVSPPEVGTPQSCAM